jgi:hypothetical protein
MHPHLESDVQPLVPPMPMPPMLGSGHYFFLLEVKVEVEEGVPGGERRTKKKKQGVPDELCIRSIT